VAVLEAHNVVAGAVQVVIAQAQGSLLPQAQLTQLLLGQAVRQHQALGVIVVTTLFLARLLLLVVGVVLEMSLR
jgi:hypothetical protein